MKNYPTSTPAELPFQVIYRECGFESYIPAYIDDETIVVGVTHPFKIEFLFNQLPCSYLATYTVEVVKPDTDTPIAFEDREGIERYLPDFISFDSEFDNFISLDDFEWSHVGKYDLKVTSKLRNIIKSEATSYFTLNVIESANITVPLPDPAWLSVIQDQTIFLREPLEYVMGKAYNDQGEPMEIEVDL